jgi:hypothetical protein
VEQFLVVSDVIDPAFDARDRGVDPGSAKDPDIAVAMQDELHRTGGLDGTPDRQPALQESALAAWTLTVPSRFLDNVAPSFRRLGDSP